MKDYSKVFIVGFSQGASLALYLGMNIKVGGVFVTGGIFLPTLEINDIGNYMLSYVGDRDIKFKIEVFIENME